jgi:hypothetical protein
MYNTTVKYHILLRFKHSGVYIHDDGGLPPKHVGGNKLFCCVYCAWKCWFYKEEIQSHCME